MLDKTTLEQRLIALEQTVTKLQQKVDTKPTSENWMQKLIGSISNEAAFLESSEYGRAFRQVERSDERS